MTGQEQVAAWKKWLASKEGQSCTKGTAEGKFLENRLWYAFNAGIEAGAAQAAKGESK